MNPITRDFKEIVIIDREEFQKQDVIAKYELLKPKYESVGIEFKRIIEKILENNDINIVKISSRVKDFEAFWEKIFRKKCQNEPFKKIKDIEGVRIIVYEPSDLKKVDELVRTNFNVIEEENKQDYLQPNQFGYRASHYTLKFPKKFHEYPFIKEIANIEFELQLCTILMHTWAEIEHKFAYKNQTQIPVSLKRSFSQLSALLEVADKLVEQITENRNEIVKQIIKSSNEKGNFDDEQPLNLDTLQAFLNMKFPKRVKRIKDTRKLLEEMMMLNTSLKELIRIVEKNINAALDKENEWIKDPETVLNYGLNAKLTQVGICRVNLEIERVNKLPNLENSFQS